MTDKIESLDHVTRVEIVSERGREYVNMDCFNVRLAFQDDERTLKVILNVKHDERSS